MKRFISLMAVLLIMAGSVFAGGRQSGSSGAAADGLTTVRIWGINKEMVLSTDTSYTLQDFYEGKVASRIWDAMQAEMTRRGIKLQMDLIMSDQMQMAFQTLLASGRFNDYDLVFKTGVTNQELYGLVNQNRLYPVNRAIEQYSDGTARDFFANGNGKPVAKIFTMADGNFYWMPAVYELWYKDRENLIGGTVVGHIRQDWLDSAGLSMPKTPDEFYNTFRTFRERDVNGIGTADEVISIDITNFFNGIAQWYGIGSDIYDNYVANINGRVVSPWYNPNIQEYFRFMNRLYGAGYIRTGGDSADSMNNKIGYEHRWLSARGGERNIIVPPGAKAAYWAPIQIEAIPGTRPLLWEAGGLSVGNDAPAFIPAAAKNVDKAVSLIDWFVSDDYYNLIEFGIEGYSYTRGSDGLLARLPAGGNLPAVDARMFPAIWVHGVFPWFQKRDHLPGLIQVRDEGKELGYPDGFTLKLDFADDYATRRIYPLMDYQGAVLALPTEQEVDRLAELLPDLETYHSELSTGLVMGEKSLSNWNTYIADLKRLGLDEVIAIHQARLDRAK
jgi:ABC-type glycerol-3-phosphate transport system substrate-binding protein